MASHNHNSSEKFEEALQLLNEAAREKKDELQKLLGEKYGDIKDALFEVASKNKETMNRIKKATLNAVEEGQERFEDAVVDIDKKVKKNPWPYIGGAAAGALLLGFILGSSNNRR